MEFSENAIKKCPDCKKERMLKMIEFDKEQPGKTNLDHVREMNAEEIGDFINRLTNCEVLSIEDHTDCAFCLMCPLTKTCGIDGNSTKCNENFANWLNQPVKV